MQTWPAGKPRFHALGETVDGRRLHVAFALRDVRGRIRATHDSSEYRELQSHHFGRRLGIRLLCYREQD